MARESEGDTEMSVVHLRRSSRAYGFGLNDFSSEEERQRDVRAGLRLKWIDRLTNGGSSVKTRMQCCVTAVWVI